MPSSGLVYRAASGKLEKTIVRTLPLADFSDAEIIEEQATSRDGTKIPMFILQKKGTSRKWKNPTLLMGYGGYGVSTQPWYSDIAHVLLEQGVVQVETVIRGGGEFGETWHEAGKLTRKQNVFDDFIACAQRLVELGYTSPGDSPSKAVPTEGSSWGLPSLSGLASFGQWCPTWGCTT